MKLLRFRYYCLGTLGGSWILGLFSWPFWGFHVPEVGLRDYVSYFLFVSVFGFPFALANSFLVQWSTAFFRWKGLAQWTLCSLAFSFLLIGGFGLSGTQIAELNSGPNWMPWIAIPAYGPMALVAIPAWPPRVLLGASATGAVLYWLRRPLVSKSPVMEDLLGQQKMGAL
jgi:hypothetical protein